MIPGVRQLTDWSATARVLWHSGLLAPVRPDRLPGMVQAVRRYGLTPATAFTASAAAHPDRLAVIDDDAEISYADLDRKTNAVARHLLDEGIGEGARVGLLARNAIGFVLALVGLGKVGATVVHLNTGFAGPAMAQALDDEGVTALVYDEEFAELLAQGLQGRQGIHTKELADVAGDDAPPPPAPSKQGGQVILTSGTTGRAKGAERAAPSGLAGIEPLTALLSAIPLRAGGTTVLAAPMFHTWGFAHLVVGGLLGSTLVVRRRFDPAATLEDITRHHASALVVVPVMLQRMVDLAEEKRAKCDASSLRVVACSGSALPVEVARRFAELYADAVYNMYGSTEVAYATVATPEDMRTAPGTVGRPLRGTVIRLLDENNEPVPEGSVGRIFVGNPMAFEGYTSGDDKARVDGLVATGDVGRFDDDGRLFVEGRDDDMIVSGGENVFPGQVEELLLARPEVADAAVVGVADEKFGQRLVAHVVPQNGGDIDSDALLAHVKSELGRIYVPREVVVHDELPRNATGKVLKRELR